MGGKESFSEILGTEKPLIYSIVVGRNKLSSTLKVLLSGLIVKETWGKLPRENNYI